MNLVLTSIYIIIAVFTGALCGVASLADLSFIFGTISAVALCIVAYKRGLLWGLGVGIITYAAIFIINKSWINALIIAVGIIIPAVFAALGLSLRVSLRKLISFTAGGHLIASLVNFYTVKLMTGKNMFDAAFFELAKSIRESRGLLNQKFTELGVPGSEALADSVIKKYDYVIELLKQLVPSLLILSSVTGALLLLFIVIKLLKKMGHSFDLQPFNMLRATKALAFLTVTLLIAISLADRMDTLSGVIINLLLLLLTYFMVCGLAVADYFTQLRIKQAKVRILIYIPAFILLSVLSILLPIFNPLTLLMAAGFADAMFNTRKQKGSDTPNGE